MKVLLIDDESDLWIGRLRGYLGKYGLEFEEEPDPQNALARIYSVRPDVVLLDLLFPGSDGQMEKRGIRLLEEITRKFPRLPVVMITSTLADAEYGVDEEDFAKASFLFSKDRFVNVADGDPYVELAAQLKQAVLGSKNNVPIDKKMGFVVGNTEKLRKVAKTIEQVATTESTVLISGESGTGKELVARALHRLSERGVGPFIPVNCGVLTTELLESQLFGHERGAFTGAVRDQKGYFEQANKGTLFLDEVDAMSPALQDKLLRVLEDRLVRPIGSESELKVDVRVVAATNKNLPALVQEGKFRNDLYYRLRVVEVELPALRERLSDLPLLYSVIVRKLNEKLGKNISTEPRADVLGKLGAHGWPGNIREFEHVLEQAVVLAKSNVLTPSAIRVTSDKKDGEHLSPVHGLILRIIARQVTWDSLKEYQGSVRREILNGLIDELSRSSGKPPSSAELAKLLNVGEGNMRRILSEADVKLRRAAKS